MPEHSAPMQKHFELSLHQGSRSTCLLPPCPQLHASSSVQFSSVSSAQCPPCCNHIDCSMPGLPVHQQLPEFTQTHVHWVGDAIQPSHPLIHFSISPSSEESGFISFRIDWFDLLAVQGTLKSLLQHHSAKASILWCSVLFIVQLSHDYWKNHSFD